jgi:predicted transcriptional regulator
MNHSISTCDRFFEKVKIPENEDECWEWLSGKNKDGYGNFSISGKYQSSHRFAYEYVNGPIPPGKIILHNCDNPGCQNYKHLELGTQQENIKDMVNKGRQNKGSENIFSILNEFQVWDMLNLIYTDKLKTIREIFEYFKTSENSVRYILKGKTWVHLTKQFPVSLDVLKTKINLQLSETEVWEMLNLINNGELKNIKDIMDRYNISNDIVRYILKGRTWLYLTDQFPIALKILKDNIMRTYLTEEEIESIIERKKYGESYKDIAISLGKTSHAIRYICVNYS